MNCLEYVLFFPQIFAVFTAKHFQAECENSYKHIVLGKLSSFGEKPIFVFSVQKQLNFAVFLQIGLFALNQFLARNTVFSWKYRRNQNKMNLRIFYFEKPRFVF